MSVLTGICPRGVDDILITGTDNLNVNHCKYVLEAVFLVLGFGKISGVV